MNILTSKRLCVAAAVASALFLWGCGGGSGTTELTEEGLFPVTIQTDWKAQPEHGGFYYALVNGYYEAAGLDVTIAQGGTGTVPANQVATGKAQFAIGRVDDIALRIDRGVPLLVVAAQMQHDPQGLILHASNPIDEWKELDGQRLFVNPGTAFVMLLEKEHGISFTIAGLDYGMARFLSDPSAIQQCFITAEPYKAKKQGFETKIMPVNSGGFDPYRIIYTTQAFAEEHPEIVRKFIDVSLRGWAEFIDEETDRSAVYEMIASKNRDYQDQGFIDFAVSTMQKYRLIRGEPEKGEEVGMMTYERMQKTIDQMISIDLLDNVTRAEEIMSIAYLPPHLQEKAGTPSE